MERVQDLQPHFKARTSSGQREHNTFQIVLAGKSQFKQWILANAAHMNIYDSDVKPEDLSAQLLVQSNIGGQAENILQQYRAILLFYIARESIVLF